MSQPSNDEIATVLDRIANLLEAQDANPHRVRAYRRGAESVRSAEESLARWIQDGDEARLQDLPDVGRGLAGVISGYVKTGQSTLLSRLQGQVAPEDLLSQVPGLGEELAHRAAAELDIESLEELEQAAHDGRLAQVDGFGSKRVRNIHIALAGILSRAAQRRVHQLEGASDQEQPEVGALLTVDAAYRRGADNGELKKIAPKRFNPEGKAWLPILHTERDGWQCTALFSNTKRAHDLDKTHDWVVIYYERDGQGGQATVVTETQGSLAGRRVVRGRDTESRRHYQNQPADE
jgi:DNA polymerase (family 10)